MLKLSQWAINPCQYRSLLLCLPLRSMSIDGSYPCSIHQIAAAVPRPYAPSF